MLYDYAASHPVSHFLAKYRTVHRFLDNLLIHGQFQISTDADGYCRNCQPITSGEDAPHQNTVL